MDQPIVVPAFSGKKEFLLAASAAGRADARLYKTLEAERLKYAETGVPRSRAGYDAIVKMWSRQLGTEKTPGPLSGLWNRAETPEEDRAVWYRFGTRLAKAHCLGREVKSGLLNVRLAFNDKGECIGEASSTAASPSAGNTAPPTVESAVKWLRDSVAAFNVSKKAGHPAFAKALVALCKAHKVVLPQ